MRRSQGQRGPRQNHVRCTGRRREKLDHAEKDVQWQCVLQPEPDVDVHDELAGTQAGTCTRIRRVGLAVESKKNKWVGSENQKYNFKHVGRLMCTSRVFRTKKMVLV
jgi:hypothetical protein